MNLTRKPDGTRLDQDSIICTNCEIYKEGANLKSQTPANPEAHSEIEKDKETNTTIIYFICLMSYHSCQSLILSSNHGELNRCNSLS